MKLKVKYSIGELKSFIDSTGLDHRADLISAVLNDDLLFRGDLGMFT